MNPPRKRTPVTLLTTTTGAAVLAYALGLIPLVATIELRTYDLRVEATARPATTDTSIALVGINDDSIQRMEPLVGRWPWPRLVHAQLIDYLAAGGAKVIAYDVLFAEHDRHKFMVGDTEWTGEESDAALVEATKKAGNVVHAAEASSAELVMARPWQPADDANPCIEHRPRLTPPFEALAAASKAIGHTYFVYDADGPLRRTSPVIEVDGRPVLSLALASTMTSAGLRREEVGVVGESLKIGSFSVPLIPETIADYEYKNAHACRALIAWRGPAQNLAGQPTFESFSFYELFYSQQQVIEKQKPKIDPAIFKDRIVIVGVTAQGLHDVFTTSFGKGPIAGPEVYANIIDAWQQHRVIVPGVAWQGVVHTLVLALFVAAVGMFANVWITGAAALVALASVAGLSMSLFAMGFWIPVTVPSLAIAFTFVGDLTWKYVVEGREKRQVQKLFARFVAKDVYDQLVADPSLAMLGGKRRDMTVLFSDVRGFTALAEKGVPEDVVRQLNEYFSRMVQVLFAHRGTLDKFVGDMLMALFGAPLDDEEHAEHAVQTALAMAGALDELNREWESRGMIPLSIGIGINTGDMVAGNIGSDTIMSYTVIGDAVNLGARLESLNKEYGTRVIISDATRVRLKGRYDIRPLGEVIVKGKSEAVVIFEVKQL